MNKVKKYAKNEKGCYFLAHITKFFFISQNFDILLPISSKKFGPIVLSYNFILFYIFYRPFCLSEAELLATDSALSIIFFFDPDVWFDG